MSSQRQIDANRRNGKLSTGPKNTANTRFNPTKHGLRSPRLTPLDDPEEYKKLCSQLQRDWQPKNCVEQMLIEKAALCAVKATTAEKLESRFVASDLDPCRCEYENMPDLTSLYGKVKVLNPGTPAAISHDSFMKLLLYQRYGATSMKLFFRALHELERMQNRRRGETQAPPQVIDVLIHPAVPVQEKTGVNPRPTSNARSSDSHTPRSTIEESGVSDLPHNGSEQTEPTGEDPKKSVRDVNSAAKQELETEGLNPKNPKNEASAPAFWQPQKSKTYWSK